MQLEKGNNANQSGDTGEKVFSQAEVDQIIKERLERERKRFNTDADMMSDLQKQVTELKSELSATRGQYLEKEKAYADEKIKNGLHKLLEAEHVLDPIQLSGLFIGKASLNNKGELIATVDGKDIPMEEHVKSWAKNNRWAIRSMQRSGSGAKGLGIHLEAPESKQKELLRSAFGLRKDK